ncbi:MAG: hypothetical protein IJ554_05985 [Paludibacteraceae bacterium]|nr:hypothetical protein [Paludibacteraceae bacterium]
MKKIYSLLAAVLFAGSMMAAEELKATINFASNDFGLPTSKSVDANTYTYDGISITLTGTSGNGYAYYTNGNYVLLGKNGATFAFSAFEWNTTKIVVTGRSGASGATKMNVFVGTTAVSTETTGCTGTNEYEINADYQAAGNVYVLKVTSAHNAQFTKIEIYGEDAASSDEPAISAAAVNFGTIYVAEGAAAEPIVKELTVTGANLSEAIEAAGSENVAVEGELDEEGGVLTLTITPAAGEFNETITLTSGATSKEVAVTGNVVEVHEYSVDEAIAASLQDNDFVGVKGVVTKMEIKPKNFLQYGSVNIYVADAEGGEGEFEFYNCYSLSADTFKVTVPAITDATSTTWTQLESVADVNNVNVAVGDTVVAWGKYTYYASNDMHELNTGCYLVSITKPGSVVPSALPALSGEQKAAKRVLNGQLIIERDGLRYNAQGTLLR